ncbi:MAG TPA: thiamine diphosphokinase, partial [Lachnospiraceae bacterium]
IISGGSIDRDFCLSFIKEWRADYLIGVDKGLDFCKEEGIFPDYILGDFDSVKPDSLEFFKSQTIEVEIHPSKKDETDTQLAVEKAIRFLEENNDLKNGEICLLGATGSRLDHVLGNIHLLAEPAKRGIHLEIVDKHNKIIMLSPGRYLFKKEKENGKYFSFFPFTDYVDGLTLDGFVYELKNYRMEKETIKGYGVSNRLKKGEASLKFDSGLLLCMVSVD